MIEEEEKNVWTKMRLHRHYVCVWYYIFSRYNLLFAPCFAIKISFVNLMSLEERKRHKKKEIKRLTNKSV